MMLDQAAYDRAQEAQEYRDEVLDALIKTVERNVLDVLDPIYEMLYTAPEVVPDSVLDDNVRDFRDLILTTARMDQGERDDAALGTMLRATYRGCVLRIAASQLDARLAELKRQADEDRAESQR